MSLGHRHAVLAVCGPSRTRSSAYAAGPSLRYAVVTFVRGEKDVAYLKKRYEALKDQPLNTFRHRPHIHKIDIALKETGQFREARADKLILSESMC